MRAGILVLGPLFQNIKKQNLITWRLFDWTSKTSEFSFKCTYKIRMKYNIKKGYIYAGVEKKLKGTLIKFPQISVGATENSIIAATLADGETILKNCAIEPEIKDLTNFIICRCKNKMDRKKNL